MSQIINIQANNILYKAIVATKIPSSVMGKTKSTLNQETIHINNMGRKLSNMWAKI